MEFSHYSVMLNECIEALNINPNGIYVDCTAGGGGHSEAILEKLDKGTLISLDQDDEAIEACKKRLARFNERSIIVKSNFSELEHVLNDLEIVALCDLIPEKAKKLIDEFSLKNGSITTDTENRFVVAKGEG